ncbi:MAG TPA: hypothetical protein VJ576_06585 [Rhodocyclaceae bacterium]|nr:hypothetical protein [Rhodocyclaceae bacterium]
MKRSAYNPAGLVTKRPISLRLMPSELQEAERIAATLGISMAKLAREAYLRGLPLVCTELYPPLALARSRHIAQHQRSFLNDDPEPHDGPLAAFAHGKASIQQYDELARMHEVLAHASSHANDPATQAACAEAKIALDNIRDRFARIKRMDASEEDLNRLAAFLTAHRAFWSSQPTGSYDIACNRLKSTKRTNVTVVPLAQ